MRYLRLRLVSPDILALAFGILLTALTARVAADVGAASAVPLVAALCLCGVMALTVLAPHVLVASLIPIFVALPMLKALVVPWIGPLKDALVLAAAAGVAVLVVKRRGAGEPHKGDRFAFVASFGFLGLYVFNLGGRFEAGAYDDAWLHGVRLTAEPIVLLAVGLLLPQARKAFRWGMISLAVTAVGVALVGLAQQRVGPWGLVELGYEFDLQVRTAWGRLRSFGSLDDPFAYAAFLLSGLVAVAFYLRRSSVAVGAGVILLGGLFFGYVRTSLTVLVALTGLWLARRRHAASAILVLAASFVAGVAVLVANTDVSENRVVRADTDTYLTVNGRTQVWQDTLVSPWQWLLGRGVGEVGTAAERASFGVYRTAEDADADVGRAIDNGYLATVADVGVLGLVLLLALLARLGQLAWQAAAEGIEAGWVAVAFLLVLLLDAVTRASFTAFPTAFSGLLLIGLALNASEAERRARRPES